MNWIDKLDKKLRERVTRLERQRGQALADWIDCRISMDEARAIVAKCNVEIAKIAEGAA